MKILSLAVFLFAVYGKTSARTFQNPILPDVSEPGVILDEGVYYLVTPTIEDKNLAIYTSTSLENWTPATEVFQKNSLPQWTDPATVFHSPRIFKVGNKFNLYYAAKSKDSGRFCIGVASASNPNGPYSDLGTPLYYDDRFDLDQPTFVTWQSKYLYLCKAVDNLLIFSIQSANTSFSTYFLNC